LSESGFSGFKDSQDFLFAEAERIVEGRPSTPLRNRVDITENPASNNPLNQVEILKIP
jgi:hypothetical protein